MHIPLDFGEGFSDGSFGLWAINFSGDGKFILAGSSDYATYLYDVEAQRVVAKAHAHKDDVNTVCFMGDSGQVYLSGSDDCMIKVRFPAPLSLSLSSPAPWKMRVRGPASDASFLFLALENEGVGQEV